MGGFELPVFTDSSLVPGVEATLTVVKSAFTVSQLNTFSHVPPLRDWERGEQAFVHARLCQKTKQKKLEAELQIRFSCTSYCLQLLFAATGAMSMSWVTLTVLLVFSSCSCTTASGQTSCSLSGRKCITLVYLPNYDAYHRLRSFRLACNVLLTITSEW